MKSGAGSEQAAQQAASTLRQGQASYAQSQASVTSAVKNQAAAEAQKASAIASLHQAEAQAEAAQQNLDYTTITAAQPGRVVKLSGSKGQYVQAGQAISMFVPDEIWVTANFKETDLPDLRKGAHVKVTVDAIDGRKFEGKVEAISSATGATFTLLPPDNASGNFTKVVQRVPVKISLAGLKEDDAEKLRVGLSAYVKVSIH